MSMYSIDCRQNDPYRKMSSGTQLRRQNIVTVWVIRVCAQGEAGCHFEATAWPSGILCCSGNSSVAGNIQLE
jgi:hypothetical protein